MKKDFRNHPFKVDDTVHHFRLGIGKVVSKSEKNSSRRVIVKFKSYDYEYVYEGDAIQELSFTPYEINSNWERPYEPKEGDIVFIPGYDDLADRIAIVKDKDGEDCYAFYNLYKHKLYVNLKIYKGCNHPNVRPATEDERNIIFDALEKEGWRWNAEKKELEKMPEPLKAGDLVIAWDGNPRDAAICTLLHVDSKGLSTTKVGVRHCCFENIVKFESMEQYEKIRRGEI